MEKKENGTLDSMLTKRVLGESSNQSPQPKRIKVVPYEIDEKLEKYIAQDTCNEKLWEELKESVSDGKQVMKLCT